MQFGVMDSVPSHATTMTHSADVATTSASSNASTTSNIASPLIVGLPSPLLTSMVDASVSNNYAPKNILVTGGAGFIGSNVIIHLLRQYPNYNIICLDKMEYCATMNNLNEVLSPPNVERKSSLPNGENGTTTDDLSSRFTFVKGDIGSADLVAHLLKAYSIDTIINFAAQTHVDNSFKLALDFTRTNVYGTHVLLESAKRIKPQIQRFIHVSTDEVYGESLLTDNIRLHESSHLNPSNPYAATKVAAEFLVRSYQMSFGLPTIITRGNNIYGPKQFPEKIIPKFIHLLTQRKPCPIHGDGNHRRSYLYVDDVSSAFDCILHRGSPGAIYNIGSEEEVSNLDILKTLLKHFHLEHDMDRYIQFVRDRPYNDLRYFINTDSLKALGWKKQVTFNEGLSKTIEWYHNHPNHWGDIGDAFLAPHTKITVKIGTEDAE